MAFLIITESIESTIDSLQNEISLLTKVFESTQDQKYLRKKEQYEGKLQAAIRYKEFFEKKSAYDQIKHLKTINPKKYIAHCKSMCSSLKGVCFVEKRMEFRVRIQLNGKRKELGSFDTPHDALEILQLYI